MSKGLVNIIWAVGSLMLSERLVDKSVDFAREYFNKNNQSAEPALLSVGSLAAAGFFVYVGIREIIEYSKKQKK